MPRHLVSRTSQSHALASRHQRAASISPVQTSAKSAAARAPANLCIGRLALAHSFQSFAQHWHLRNRNRNRNFVSIRYLNSLPRHLRSRHWLALHGHLLLPGVLNQLLHLSPVKVRFACSKHRTSRSHKLQCLIFARQTSAVLLRGARHLRLLRQLARHWLHPRRVHRNLFLSSHHWIHFRRVPHTLSHLYFLFAVTSARLSNRNVNLPSCHH